MTPDVPSDDADYRLDKWLWAARFFKTRALAAEAIDAGKVLVDGERVKRARRVRLGDRLGIRLGPYEHRIVVQAISNRRGPASEAATLYEEIAESVATREKLKLEIKASQNLFAHGEGKPSKKDRRDLLRLKGKGKRD
ncbi:MAG: S4 domain-containing protein [Gemmatimonadota bacterium]